MFSIVLALHIAIALTMGALSLRMFYRLSRGRIGSIAQDVKVLSLLLAGELVTGSVMALISPKGVSFGDFCENVALYLSLTGVVFLVAWWRARGEFVFGRSLAPILPALGITTVTALGLL
jgi:hypothetical protein